MRSVLVYCAISNKQAPSKSCFTHGAPSKFISKRIHFEVLRINITENPYRIDSKQSPSLTSVGTGAALPAHRGLVLRFAEGLQVYRGFPDRGNRLRDAVSRVARWIWRGLHVVF